MILCIPILLWACSTKKNTSTTRWYHSVNTRYNIYFNANESYKMALKEREESHQDTLSQILEIYPIYPTKSSSSESSSNPNDESSNKGFSQQLKNAFSQARGSQDTQQQQSGGGSTFGSGGFSSGGVGGSFSRSIDKNTKAIKLHSIKAKPERNPSKKRDPQYQAWLQQQEFNPFLKNAWLLLGKSEYQDGDYLQASSTFSYITRIYKPDPKVVAEARIWLVRANVAMGWYYEAEDILNQIRLAGGVPENLQPEYDKVYADFLIKKKDYAQAVPFLEKAIGKEGGGLQKTRMKYLLGQLYKEEGNRERAYSAFDDVHGLSTPYLYSFNARIQQASFVDATNKQQILSMLNKMAKDTKNKDYLDQVYYAVGNIYLNDKDTVKAVENYRLSIDKSTRSGYDKALTAVVLGDIYFTKKDYIRAQPCYSDALNLLSKKHKDYALVSLRSAVLDELVVFVEAVHLQDSLQTLGRMPESERLVVVHKIIEDLRKKEREAAAREARENLLADRQENLMGGSTLFESKSPNIPTGPIVTGATGTSVASFYFYNPQVVTQGKANFQRKWGIRKLEDNWRRRDKQVMSFGDDTNQFAENDSVSTTMGDGTTAALADTITQDLYSPEFYLQQIPSTPEAIEASNVIIEDAYFNMGKIYKDKLQDYNLAIDAFGTDLRRFPNTPNLEEIYYQLFLIYLRLGNTEMTELYRLNLLNAFPNSSYAGALSDPNYASNMLNMYQVESGIYEQTYELYLGGKINQVRDNYKTMKERYPLSTLMPKFMFLEALTYAQTNNPEQFKTGLKNLINEFPKSDVTPLASEMLKGLMDGKELSSDASPFRGMIWDIKFGGDSISATTGVDFVADAAAEHMLLMIYKPRSIDKNQLIYEVANYNFSNYVYQTFDLGFNTSGGVEMLQIKGFKNLGDIVSYVDKAFTKNSLMSLLDPSIIPVPISTGNYVALMNGKTLNEYFLFLEKNYTKEMLTLIKYWTQQREKTVTNVGEAKPPQETVEPAETKEKTPSEVRSVQPQPIPADSVSVVPQIIPVSPILPQEEIAKRDSTKTEFGFGNMMTGDQMDQVDGLVNKGVEIFNNPVDGLKNIFKSSDNKGWTKEEKAAHKAEEKLRKAEAKKKKDDEKAKVREAAEAEKMRQDSIRNIEHERIDAEKAVERAKIEEQKSAEKAKDDVRKQREQELKDKEKARQDELKRKENERKDRLKQREQERKEKMKQRDQELKQREQDRKNKERQSTNKK